MGRTNTKESELCSFFLGRGFRVTRRPEERGAFAALLSCKLSRGSPRSVLLPVRVRARLPPPPPPQFFAARPSLRVCVPEQDRERETRHGERQPALSRFHWALEAGEERECGRVPQGARVSLPDQKARGACHGQEHGHREASRRLAGGDDD